MDDDKVVCGCTNVTIQNLRDAIENGAKSFEEIQSVINVDTRCGQCVDSVKSLVNELLGK
ncbi:(2Fe-2S)-binding protein [Clostridium beijerinckii]|nr:(2Fe-2S)-binding protein [Clostridium beijerinckii]